MGIQDATQEYVAVWQIGDNHSGAGFADVPEDPLDTIRMGEAVVSIERGR